MATAVFFHAHPDDEAIATGGTMASLADSGHRVVLVVATDGDEGQPVAGVLREGESLGVRRATEVERSAAILGVDRLVLLAYRDSGMMGEPANEHPDSFWQADVSAAADRLAVVLVEVSADVLTVYDSHGGYGHPDHIQVHRVGVMAAQRAGVARVFESTMNRDAMRDRILAAATDGTDLGADFEERRRRFEENPFGLPESDITHAIDVAAFLDRKRQALLVHESQIDAESLFLKMPPDAFAAAFGTEWFRDRSWNRGQAPLRNDLFG